MEKTANEYTTNLRGMTYVKNSKGKTSNVAFFIMCSINTVDNSTKVAYLVEVFEKPQDDYFGEEYTSYIEAVDKYNELAIKWNGHREL